MRGWVHNDIEAEHLAGSGGHVARASSTSSTLEWRLAGTTSWMASPLTRSSIGYGSCRLALYASLTAMRAPHRQWTTWNLVCVLCFLTTGRLPWRGERREHVAQLKRRMRKDGCSSMGEDSEASRELQALWSAVSAWATIHRF